LISSPCYGDLKLCPTDNVEDRAAPPDVNRSIVLWPMFDTSRLPEPSSARPKELLSPVLAKTLHCPRHDARERSFTFLVTVVTMGCGDERPIRELECPMTMSDWSHCLAVERSDAKMSGAWVFRGTRMPVKSLFENLEDGATLHDFLDWFPGVGREQVLAVMEFALQGLTTT
jgi:uncharacterized protein (DUF433 family)